MTYTKAPKQCKQFRKKYNISIEKEEGQVDCGNEHPVICVHYKTNCRITEVFTDNSVQTLGGVSKKSK